ncbi:MAG: hypothetical protein RL196_341 [Actinomycetota bacterium]|jgi:cell division protein FtsI (penicillin-binding protein 3)
MRSVSPRNNRLVVVMLIVTLVAVACVVRLVQFQVLQATEINKISYDRRATTVPITALRGDIVDADGQVLATTVIRYDINAAPDIVKPISRMVDGQLVTLTPDDVATELAPLLKMKPAEIVKKITGTTKYANIKKKVSATIYRKILALDIPWLFYDDVPVRVYPNGAVAGNLVGFLGSDGTPLAGLERTMNECLAGVDGTETYEQGVDGIKIPSSTVTTRAARNGSKVVLTIHNDLQYSAQQVITNYVKSERADWGSAVIVEAKTGKILTAAEYPSVDPNVFFKSKAADRGSRIFQATFEPGSTMKTVAAATALDVGKATPSTQVRAPQTLYLPWGDTISDSHAHPTQKLTLTGVLRDSSNTGIVQIAGKVSAATRYKYLKMFGIGESTAVHFEGESGGIMSPSKQWDKLTNLVTMFGQGLAVTPIQTAYFYQTIANQGTRLPAQLVAGCQASNGKLVAPVLPKPVSVLSPATARSTVDMLEKVVEQGGIGRTAGIDGWRIGGKSGTAQLREGKGYGYLHAISFIGMAPAEDPQYVLAVTIYKPRTVSNSIGATPPFKAIMNQILRTFSVPFSHGKSANIPTEW